MPNPVTSNTPVAAQQEQAWPTPTLSLFRLEQPTSHTPACDCRSEDGHFFISRR